MKQVTVIGDIHGCFDTFMELLKKIPKEDQIVLVGDLIDRGPKSKQVVQYVIDHPEILCVKANHEDMAVTDLLGKSLDPYHGEWLVYQGGQTLESYKPTFDSAPDFELLKEHAKWMKELPLYLEFPDCIKIGDDEDYGKSRHLVVSHSSIGSTWKYRDPDHPKHHFFKDKALWNRDIPDNADGLYNVFGHTPVYGAQPIVRSFYANVDTGCVFNRNGFAKLTAIRFPSLEIIQQQNIDTNFIEL